MGAALDVLDLHARHKVTAINCVCRDLLRIYYVKADQAQSLEPQDKELLGLLHDTAVDLGYAIEVGGPSQWRRGRRPHPLCRELSAQGGQAVCG